MTDHLAWSVIFLAGAGYGRDPTLKFATQILEIGSNPVSYREPHQESSTLRGLSFFCRAQGTEETRL